MRYFLNVLFVLALLPAVAKAAPFAEYNPATGDIRIREISEISSMNIRSASGALDPDVLDAMLETAPANASKPLMQVNSISGLLVFHPSGRFPFTSLTIHGAFLPGTPVADVSYFDTFRVSALRQGTVVAVPEPSSIALTCIGATGLAALRRRKQTRRRSV